MKRGRETQEHRMMKWDLKDNLALRNWVVRFETGNADVVGIKPGETGVWAFECERSSKWVLRNITRDLARGACGVVVVAANERIALSARRIVGQLSENIRARVHVVILAELDGVFTENDGIQLKQ